MMWLCEVTILIGSHDITSRRACDARFSVDHHRRTRSLHHRLHHRPRGEVSRDSIASSSSFSCAGVFFAGSAVAATGGAGGAGSGGRDEFDAVAQPNSPNPHINTAQEVRTIPRVDPPSSTVTLNRFMRAGRGRPGFLTDGDDGSGSSARAVTRPARGALRRDETHDRFG